MLQEVGGVRSVTPPLEVDAERLRHEQPPPLLGEHSRDVLREIGYDDAAIDALVARGVVGSSA